MLKTKFTLIVGDVLVLAIITVIGFASHGEVDISFLLRMLTTFVPLVVSWFLIAPWLGLFEADIHLNQKQLWRAPLAMILAAPIATTLRAGLLRSTAIPLFTLILGGSSALGMLVWRAIWYIITYRKGR